MNIFIYCGLNDAKIRASDKDLPVQARYQKLTSPVLMLYLKSLIAGLLAPVSGAKVEFQGVTAGAKIPTPMTSFSNPVPSKSKMIYFFNFQHNRLC